MGNMTDKTMEQLIEELSMSKQESKIQTAMLKKTSQYANSQNKSTPVREMEFWDEQWANQQQGENQWNEDNKNYYSES